jgi:hypothetical protein
MYIVLVSHPLHWDHNSPCTKRARSSFVVMRFPMTKRVLGQKSPSRSDGGTQKRGSEFELIIQPSSITESSMKGAEVWVRYLTMGQIG